jgi:hypothetical protein
MGGCLPPGREIDGFPEGRGNGDFLDQRRLGAVLLRDHDAREPPARSLGHDRKDASNRSQRPVERELAEKNSRHQPFRRPLPHGGDDTQGDRRS